jgi:hypothetical protein
MPSSSLVRRKRTRPALALLALTATAAGFATACGGHEAPPRLADGSPPPPVPAALAGIPNAVGTRLELRPLRALPRALLRSCGTIPASATGALPAAFRITRLGASLSLLAPSGRLAYGCDALRAPPRLRWCGAITGKLVRGRLLDPRLDLCGGGTRPLVAFAWVEPLPAARWLVVRDGGDSDVYEIGGGGIPVRVAVAHDIDVGHASARFFVSQYDAAGRRLAESRLEAAVAG